MYVWMNDYVVIPLIHLIDDDDDDDNNDRHHPFFWFPSSLFHV
jgi:hypothetical protein